MRWRRGSKFILANSIVMGASRAGLVVEQDSTGSYYSQSVSRFYNSFLNAVQNPYQVSSTGSFLDVTTLQSKTETTNGSKLFTSASAIGLTDPFNNASPNLKPAAGSEALTTAAKFDLGALSEAFFTPVNYIGAFDGTNDWTSGWTAWNR
jgi:hypothetical protein